MNSKHAILDAVATLECLLCALRLPVDKETNVALYTLTNTITNLLRDSAKFASIIIDTPKVTNANSYKVHTVQQHCSESGEQISIDLEIKEEEPEVVQPLDQLYECPYCNVKLKSSYILEKHLFKHEDMADSELPTAELIFDADEEMESSTALETEEEISKIDASKIPNSGQASSSQHQLQCDHCNYQTNIIRLMEQHAAAHSESRPFKCQQCEYRAKRMDSVRSHHVRIHGMDNALRCEICRFVCPGRRELQAHYDKGCHGVPLASNSGCSSDFIVVSEIPSEGDDADRDEDDARSELPGTPQSTTDSKDMIDLSGADAPSTSWFAACKNEFGIVNPSIHEGKRTDTRHQCDSCFFGSNRVGEMEEHAKKHSESFPFRCEHCDYRSKRHDNLRCHQRRKHGEKNLKCPNCSFCTTTKQDLAEHSATCSVNGDRQDPQPNPEDGSGKVRGSRKPGVRKNVPTRRVVCDICGITTSRINQHRALHESERPFKCTFCDFDTKDATCLKYHIRTHTKEKPNACHLCDYKGPTPSGLRRHLITHSGVKPYICDICGHKAALPSELRKHYQIHNGVKRHKCTFCDYKTLRSVQLKIHLRKHTGEKPYSCKLCDFKGSTTSAIARHMTTHTGAKPFKCELCDYRGSQKSFVRTHMKTHNKFKE